MTSQSIYTTTVQDKTCMETLKAYESFLIQERLKSL